MDPLFRLPVSELLHLWSELEQAYHGTHGFGGNTAEIYAYRLLRDSPTLRSGREGSELVGRAELEAAQEAYAIMHALLRTFAEERDCRITVDGTPLGCWNKPGLFYHRAHVTVIPKDADDRKRQSSTRCR